MKDGDILSKKKQIQKPIGCPRCHSINIGTKTTQTSNESSIVPIYICKKCFTEFEFYPEKNFPDNFNLLNVDTQISRTRNTFSNIGMSGPFISVKR